MWQTRALRYSRSGSVCALNTRDFTEQRPAAFVDDHARDFAAR